MNLLAQFYGTMKIGAGLAGALILIALLKGEAVLNDNKEKRRRKG